MSGRGFEDLSSLLFKASTRWDFVSLLQGTLSDTDLINLGYNTSMMHVDCKMLTHGCNPSAVSFFGLSSVLQLQ